MAYLIAEPMFPEGETRDDEQKRLHKEWKDMTTATPIYTTTNRDLINMYNERTGGHFFDADTMRFFNSRILNPVYYAGPSAIVFITSERHEGHYWDGNAYRLYDEGRKYTVRVWDGASASIDTVGEFQQYTTSGKAKKAAQAYVQEVTS